MSKKVSITLSLLSYTEIVIVIYTENVYLI